MAKNKKEKVFMDKERIKNIKAYFGVAQFDDRGEKKGYFKKILAKISRLFSKKREVSGVGAYGVHKKLETSATFNNTCLRPQGSVIREKLDNLRSHLGKLISQPDTPSITITTKYWNECQAVFGRLKARYLSSLRSHLRKEKNALSNIFTKLKNLKTFKKSPPFFFSICEKRKVVKDWLIGVIEKERIRKVYFKKTLALVTIFAVIVMAYWQNVPQAQAATFTLY